MRSCLCAGTKVGLGPPFVLGCRLARAICIRTICVELGLVSLGALGTETKALTTLLAPSVEGLGYELVGVEYVPAGARSVLRVYIDAQDGIDVDDCAAVSHQVSGLLDVEDPIPGQYALEVSSPGLDRPLFTAEHFRQFAGHAVKIVLHDGIEGRRRVTGTISDVGSDDVITVVVDGERFDVALDAVSKANLVPDV